MSSIVEAIRHYQRRIDRSLQNEAVLLHCLERLNKLPIVVKYLRETSVGRTVNNLRKYDGKVGYAAEALVAKWKKEVEENITESSGEPERRHKNETENIEPSIMNTDNQKRKRDPVDGNTSSETGHSEQSQEGNTQLETESTGDYDEEKSKSDQSSHSISKSSDKREESSTTSGYRTDNRNHSKRREHKKTNDRKRRCEPDVIDIDSTTGTSFADALGMLDIPSTSKKLKKLSAIKPSTSNASLASKHKSLSEGSSSDETPILLTKRPRLEPPLDIDVDLIQPSINTSSEASTLEFSSRLPRKQSTRMTDEETIGFNTKSRTVKTKVFSGNKGDKCKVASLFEMCIRILQDNIDLLEFIGGVPFDILRPVLERTTCEQLMTLEDYNPYLMEDTHCLWEQHCKRRFRNKSREELETWRDMYIRCLDEEQRKFNILTASIKLSKERQTKPAYVDTNALRHTNANKVKRSESRVAPPVVNSKEQNATKSKDATQNRKRPKKSNEDPDWTPTTWYKTLYKKPKESKPVKPPKPPIKKTIDMLRYDRAKALEQKKEEWKKG